MNNHFKIWLNRLIALLLVTGHLSGCSITTTNSRHSQEMAILTPIDSQKIAKYVVNLLLLNGYSAKETTFFFDRDKNNGYFGQALESQLQKTGYTLASTHVGAQKVTYILDELAPGAYRVNIRVEPDYQMEFVSRLSNNDRLVLHSVTVRNGSSLAAILVEANNDLTNAVKGHETETANIAKQRVFSEDDEKKENTNPVSLSKVPESWSVQVISLSENKPGVLETISSKIEAMGYQTYIAEDDNAKKVRVGPFDSLAAVKPVLDKMRANGYPDAFLSSIE